VTNGEGRVYLNGEQIIKEDKIFKPDRKSRRVFIGQDEFEVINLIVARFF